MKNEYRIEGDTVIILIKRRNGDTYECYIDAEDLPLLLEMDVSWYLNVKPNGVMYAICNNPGGKGTTKMHRVIYPAKRGELIDHRDRNGLNNRKNNLRVASKSLNTRNSKPSTRNTSGHPGVSWHATSSNWRAYIQTNGKRVSLGYYDTKEEAIEVRKNAEKEYWKDVQ